MNGETLTNLRPIAPRTHHRPVIDLYDWASRDHETTVPPQTRAEVAPARYGPLRFPA